MATGTFGRKGITCQQFDLTNQQSENTYKTKKSDIALDKLSVKKRRFLRKITPSGVSKEAKTIRLELSESPRLEMRAGNRAYSPRANHPFDGWL